MSLKSGKRRLRRLPLSLAVTGAMSTWVMCATAVAGAAPTSDSIEIRCDSDVAECKETGFTRASNRSSSGGAIFNAGYFGNGDGVSMGVPGYTATATLVGDIALGSSAYAAGSETMSAIAMGNSADASASNAAYGWGSVANAAGMTDGVALGDFSTVNRSHAISVGSASLQRRIQNVAYGVKDTDAINVNQLTALVNTLGADIDSGTGAVIAPTFTVGGATQANFSTAVGTLDSSITATNAAIAKFASDFSDGAAGLVQQVSAGAPITVGANIDGELVNFVNNGFATRTLTGVSAGELSNTSTDAVNGSQLFATNQQVGTNTSNINNQTQRLVDISNGAAGLVLQNADTGALSVGTDTAGILVDVAGTAGGRVLTGVAKGNVASGSTDLVNGAQLYAINQQISSLDVRATSVIGNISDIQNDLADLSPGFADFITYDDASKSRLTLAGADGTLLSNVSAGLIAAGSMDAVNGGQLFDFNALFEGELGDLSDRADDLASQWDGVEKGIADGTLQPGHFDGDAGGKVISGVAPGIADTDGVNVGQMTDMLANAVQQAQNYTDQQAAAFSGSLNSFKQEVDQRFKKQDERLDRIGAMNAASTHMVINASGATTTSGRAAIGAGMQNGKGAVALGYARPIGERTSVSIGGTFSGPEKQAGVGVSVSL